MNLPDITTLANKALNRRKFLKGTGMAGLGIASATLIGGSLSPLAGQTRNVLGMATGKSPTTIHDTPTDIFTAALVAEDLATTFYYNALVGPVIQDPNLAGPGGTPHNPNPNDSNPGNVAYLQAAFSEEIDHAGLMRTLLGLGSSTQDPYQTFYFPAGTFDTLPPFLALLDALENAFIGAYLTAVQEFAVLAVERDERLHVGPTGILRQGSGVHLRGGVGASCSGTRHREHESSQSEGLRTDGRLDQPGAWIELGCRCTGTVSEFIDWPGLLFAAGSHESRQRDLQLSDTGCVAGRHSVLGHHEGQPGYALRHSPLRRQSMLDGIFQPMHLLVILFIALMIFGPKKLPELGKGLGDGIRAFKDGIRHDTAEGPRQSAPK